MASCLWLCAYFKKKQINALMKSASPNSITVLPLLKFRRFGWQIILIKRSNYGALNEHKQQPLLSASQSVKRKE